MRSPRVGPWGPKVHGGGAARGGRSRRSRARSWTRVLLVVAAAGRRRPSTFALVGATGKRNVRRRRHGDVGRMAAECTCTAREFGRCARPHRAARQDRARRARPRRRLRQLPVRPADERLADRNPRSLLAVLAGTVQLVEGPDHEPMPAGRYRPRAWHVLAAGVEPDGPVDADGDQALVIYEARHPTVLLGGEAARPWDTATGALVRRPRRRRGSWPPLP